MRGRKGARKARRSGKGSTGQTKMPSVQGRGRARRVASPRREEAGRSALPEVQRDFSESGEGEEPGNRLPRRRTSRDRLAYAHRVKEKFRRECLWCDRPFQTVDVVLGTDTHNFCGEVCALASLMARERGTWSKDRAKAKRTRTQEVKKRMRVARAARGR